MKRRRKNTKGKGWHNEPGRHALAARGVETAQEFSKKMRIERMRTEFDFMKERSAEEIEQYLNDIFEPTDVEWDVEHHGDDGIFARPKHDTLRDENVEIFIRDVDTLQRVRGEEDRRKTLELNLWPSKGDSEQLKRKYRHMVHVMKQIDAVSAGVVLSDDWGTVYELDKEEQLSKLMKKIESGKI